MADQGFRPYYSARALSREWGLKYWTTIRMLARENVFPRKGSNAKRPVFWTSDIEHRAPRVYDWWLKRRHEAAMAKIAKGEAA